MRVAEAATIVTNAENIVDDFAVAETTKVAVVAVQAADSNTNGTYTLIAGCFAVLENAEKQIEHLKLKNINASIIGQTKTGLYRVGCGSYNSTNDANDAMRNLKTQQTEVWVLKN